MEKRNPVIFLSQKRIEKSIALLHYIWPQHLTVEQLFSQIKILCEKNKCTASARVRLSFSNGNGGLYDGGGKLNYLIEAWSLDTSINDLNVNGMVTGFCPLVKKSCDHVANLKSASALTYSVAAQYVQQQKWNDCIILNHRENICETTIANLFWIKNGTIFTPSLTEGCVDGVMRAYLIDTIETITETPCRPIDLLEADEVFITNVIRGIRWIRSVENINYTNQLTSRLHQQYITSLF
ncbi:aminotransferase class IV [Niabella ginsengisoli]|uniref:branched-chain-amino-acid transaminase n=1 Tax=Niabella ginsengisoli TaxID=522298 RepID=A0ABS9SJH6_9BACT|nr:aminotransferase class IV [Niabella ginsengisoli]MCH5598481.1 aminotransferase class IV [Niabella ginsengisoli]